MTRSSHAEGPGSYLKGAEDPNWLIGETHLLTSFVMHMLPCTGQESTMARSSGNPELVFREEEDLFEGDNA